ncbi:MAG: PAS domain S-box protein, partial [Acidobacteriota bacterium]|nr:PAS domain S-box protein [Acidobacteriota bacterium]
MSDDPRENQDPTGSAELFRFMVESVRDYAIFAISPEGRIVSWNTGAELTFGYREEEAVGQSASIIFTPEDRERGAPQEELRKAAEEGRAEDERWHLRRDGTRFWASGMVTPLRDQEGNLRGFVKVARDQTQRKLAVETRLRLAAIVELSDDAIISKDLTGQVTSWNAGAERLFGYAEAEAVGQPITIIVPPELREEEEDILRRLRAGERIEHFETVRVDKQGRHISVSLSISPIKDAEGLIIGASKIARDISERKRAEEERLRLLENERRARAEAEAAQRRAAFLAESSEVLSSSLDYQTTVASVARMVVPDLADWCRVDLLDEKGAIRRLAVAHADPSKVKWADELARRYPTDPKAERGVPHVLRTGESELYTDIPDEMLAQAAQDDEHLRIMREVGFTSAMVVPLTARGRTVGAVSFISTDSGRRYGPEDLAFAEELARRCALAIDNARLYG